MNAWPTHGPLSWCMEQASAESAQLMLTRLQTSERNKPSNLPPSPKIPQKSDHDGLTCIQACCIFASIPGNLARHGSDRPSGQQQ
jgi:hypothetical protein